MNVLVVTGLYAPSEHPPQIAFKRSYDLRSLILLRCEQKSEGRLPSVLLENSKYLL